MDDTSILETRFHNDTETNSVPADEAACQKEIETRHEQRQIDIAESFLTFVNFVIHANVQINQRLESMQSCHTLGEGASFTVKRHYRAEKRIIKVSRQGYSMNSEQSFNKAAFSVLMKELHVLSHEALRKSSRIVAIQSLGWAIQSLEPLELCPSLYLEEAPHGTLANFEQSEVAVDSAMRRRLCLDVAHGIEALHACGIVHGDVKADNILIFDHPQGGYTAKISDFGCAVFLENYANVDPSTPVRLPGISKPWCAPEALNLVPIDHLIYADIYSLGLLLFRLMVFCNPFQVFDLPVDREPRTQYITELLSLPLFPELVAMFIEEHIEERWSRAERLGFTEIFATSLAKNPQERHLSTIIGLLKLLSEEPLDLGGVFSFAQGKETGTCNALAASKESFAAANETEIPVLDSSKDDETPKTSYETARNPSSTLPVLNLDPKVVSGLPFEVRQQIQTSLEILDEHIIQSGRNQVQLYSTGQRESIQWALFTFSLLGLGAYEPDPNKSMQALYRAGTKEGGSFWKAWSLLTLLQEALQVSFTTDQLEEIEYWTLRAMSTEGFTQRLLGSPIKQEYQNETHALSHGVYFEEIDYYGKVVASNTAGDDSKAVRDCVSHKHDFGGGNSLLHMAAIYGDLDLVKAITRCKGISIDAKNGKLETALILACQYGHTSVAEYLLDKGSDASICFAQSSVNGLYWLSSFPKEHVPHIARKLIKAGASLQHVYLDKEKSIEILDDDFLFHGRVYRSPLLRAIGNGDLTCTQVLLELGLETFSMEDQTLPIHLCFLQPMRLAASLHQYEILEYLCARLEKLFKSVVNEESATSWRSVDMGYFVQIVKSDAVACEALAMTHYVERLCIHRSGWRFAAKRTLDVLVQYGLLRQDIVITSRYGFNVRMDTLQSCAADCNVTALEYLLQRGEFKSLVNKVDTDLANTTLVDVALDRANLAVFKILMAAGAELDLTRNPDPNHRLAPDGASYIHVCAASRIKNTDFANAILDAGVPAGVVNSTGVPALTLAIMKGNFPLANLLIDRGASVNSPGLYNYTALGHILEPVMSAQCDDLVASVKYILSLTGEHEASFVIRQETGSTALILASNAFHPAPPQVQVFNLLLDKFSLPEQINGRATIKPFSTPMQVAIANHNLPAVKSLIGAGVNLSVPDHYGEDSMTLAITSIHKLMVKKTTLARRDVENDLGHALEIISVIAEQGKWPSQFKIGGIVSNILREGGPIISVMRQLPHCHRQLLGLNGSLIDVIDKYANDLDAVSGSFAPQSGLAAIVELRRQLEQALKPIFFTEVLFEIARVQDNDPSLTLTRQEIRKSGHSNLPILRNLTIKAFELLQQSAAFEFILDQVTSGRSDPQHSIQGNDQLIAESWPHLFKTHTEKNDQDSLPYDSRFVRYPQALLSWYKDPHLFRQLIIRHEADQQMLQRFIDILQRRADERERGEQILSPFDDEFKEFHFHLLHGSRLSLQRLEPILRVGCRCICMKPGKELGDIKMEKIRHLNHVLEETLAPLRQSESRELRGPSAALEAALVVTRRNWDKLVAEKRVKANEIGQPVDPESFLLEPMVERLALE